MALEEKDMLVVIKSLARVNPLPLDADEVHDSLEAAEAYAAGPLAYPGQTIKALVDGQYVSYTLQGSEPPYELTKVGDEGSGEDVKNYVQVLDELPEDGAEQGVIYIVDTKGYIYNGTEFVVVFKDWSAEIEAAVEDKAPIDSPVFTGTVTLAADPTEDLEAVTKQYVDRLVAGLSNSAPGVVDGSNDLPEEGYKAGQTWRVAEDGEYGGHTCEAGDLIICIKDYDADAEDHDDFIVVQGNIDGAVTGPDSSTDANIVVFDGITGKKIADSNVTLASLTDAIAKAHEHENLEILNSYDKTQEELLEAAAEDAQAKVDELAETVVTAEALAERIGEIPETTSIKDYIDTAVGSGGTDSADAIAAAKAEAIEAAQNYTDNALTIIEY